MSFIPSLSPEKRKKLLPLIGISAAVLLISLGVFASNGWLPSTDPMTGKKTGWFGKELPKNASSSWNPLAPPLPTPTPQLSKEYIYAGSRLLAVEDANATQAPPADIAVWRPSSGVWWVMGQTGSQAVEQAWGVAAEGDIPMPGDYDGDGKTDFAVWRQSTGVWWILHSDGSGYTSYGWGYPTDTPVPADYDGDGKTDIAIIRFNTTTNVYDWWVLKSSDSGWLTWQWGLTGDIPGPADFDGDGKADIAMYRPSNNTYYAVNSSNPTTAQTVDLGQSVTCSIAHNCIVPSDYDGDGKADFAIYKSSTAYWYIHYSTTNTTSSIQWGASGDVPVQNDYDGDGKTDIAVWRAHPSLSPWYIRQSSTGTTRTETWGITGDIPVPAFYRR